MVIDMLSSLALRWTCTLAEVVSFEQAGKMKIEDLAGRLTMAWVTVVFGLMLLLLVGFKRAKRTHLD